MAFVDDGVKLVAGGAVLAFFEVEVEILVGFRADDAVFSVEEGRGVGADSGAGFEGLVIFFKQLGRVLGVIWRNTVLEVRNVRFGDKNRTTCLGGRIVYITCRAACGADIKIFITSLANALH